MQNWSKVREDKYKKHNGGVVIPIQNTACRPIYIILSSRIIKILQSIKKLQPEHEICHKLTRLGLKNIIILLCNYNILTYYIPMKYIKLFQTVFKLHSKHEVFKNKTYFNKQYLTYIFYSVHTFHRKIDSTVVPLSLNPEGPLGSHRCDIIPPTL